MDEQITEALDKLDETIDLPLTQEKACSLSMILSQAVVSTENLINVIKADRLLPEEKRRVQLDGQVTLDEMQNLYELILDHAKELYQEVNQIVIEHDRGPKKPEKPNLILPNNYGK